VKKLNVWCKVSAELEPYLNPLVTRYLQRALRVEAGRNRVVFIMPHGYVIKLPRTLDGFGDNDWEGSVSNGPGQSLEAIQYPKTKLHYWKEIPILFMEYVEWATNKDIEARLGKEPNWVGFVDCGQVGFTSTGRLVAFDYGPN
jgi:hypothetical protein